MNFKEFVPQKSKKPISLENIKEFIPQKFKDRAKAEEKKVIENPPQEEKKHEETSQEIEEKKIKELIKLIKTSKGDVRVNAFKQVKDLSIVT